MTNCRVCGIPLDEKNWVPSRMAKNERICMDCDHEDQNARYRALREETIIAYGGKCECCGDPHHEFLTIDHISGKGAEHRRQLGLYGSYKFYAWLKRMGWPKDDYQLLCWNCLHYSTRVVMADGSHKKIGEIVNERLPGPVLSFDFDSGRPVPGKIINWYKTTNRNVKWMKVITSNTKRFKRRIGSPRLTDDHEVYVKDKGMIPVRELESGDLMMSSIPEISGIQRQIIIGSILGDGNLAVTKEGNNAFFRVGHCESQKLYLLWKLDHLRNIVRGPVYSEKNRTANSEIFHTFNTRSLPCLTKLHEIFYRGGVKGVPENIGELIEALGLAVWFMDDGTTQGTQSSLATYGFSEKDTDILVGVFEEKYQILTVRDKYNRLRFNKSEQKKLFKIIGPYFHKVMRYKVPGNCVSGWLEIPHDPQNYSYVLVEQALYAPTKLPEYTTYNIEVEGYHNFFISMGLVKNCNQSRHFYGYCPHGKGTPVERQEKDRTKEKKEIPFRIE